MSGPGEISRSVSARRKVINVSMEGILVESGTKFPLRYLSPIRAESGIYCSVRSWHGRDSPTACQVCCERKAEVKLIDFIVDFKSILTISQQNVASNAYNSYYHRRFFCTLLALMLGMALTASFKKYL